MKVGLLSFHNAANYGAALQAFALQKVLLENDIDCEYINYQNTFRKSAYSMSYHILRSVKKGDIKAAIKYILGSPFMTLRKFRFKLFYNKNLKYTRNVYSSSHQACELNQEYTKFIVGSDQVWNWYNNGQDDSYFLSFVDDDSKKISYSSSFGIAKIPQNQMEIYRLYLSRIKYLSVREKIGIDLLKNLTKRDACLVLDPVFLLTKRQWEQMAIKKKITERLIFSYTNSAFQFDSFLSITQYNIQNSYLYKLTSNLSISDFLNLKIRVKYSMSPTEFLTVIRDADLIVSASFHCIALSIIMNKQFVVILSGDKGKDERLLSILSLLGLEDRILNNQMNVNQVNKIIDYDRVNKEIERLKSFSMNFLISSIFN
jgi:polysaccharide pyruvyl transferase WcaK-like protein